MKQGSKLLIIFLIFAIVAFLLIYLAFFKTGMTGTFSGTFIGSDSDDVGNDSKEVSTELTIPNNFSLDREVKRVEIETRGGVIYWGDGKIGLKNLDEAEIVMGGFEGEILFDKNNILSFDGEASKLEVNEISYTRDTPTAIQINKKMSYDELKLVDFYLDSLSYKASGRVELDKGKTVINLDKEEFNMKGFEGDLTIDDKFRLEGSCEKIEAGDVKIG